MSDTPPIPPKADDPQQPTAAVAPPQDAVAVPAIVGAAETEKIAAPFHIVSEDRARRRAQVAAARARTPAEKTESARTDGYTQQSSLLVMVPVKAGHYAALEELLTRGIADPRDGSDLELNPYIPFAKIRTLHFARILLHQASPGPQNPLPTYPPPPAKGKVQVKGPPIPPRMLFATDFDGPLDAHVDELLDVAGAGLDDVFGHCEGWPGSQDRAAVHGYFLRHRIPSNTFYTGTMHRSVDQIHREEELHQKIEEFLDANAGKPDFPSEPLQIREKIREFVFSSEELAWARQKPGPFPRLLFNPDYLLPVAAGVVVALLAALAVVLRFVTGSWREALDITGVVVAVAAVLLGAAWIYLRFLEERDPVIILNKDIDDLVSVEDRIVQNQMSSVIYIKQPLWFRGLVLRAVLRFIDFSAKYLSNQGTLAGIPSIHFARWVIVDDGRRLVFFSNFDGSWENYLGDFIDKSASGLTGVWSNCVGFPRTKGLVGMGARDEQKFKAYSRDSQIPTQVWYSAYRWLSVDNVNNNSRIRLGLYDGMTADQAALWVRRFGGSTNVDNNGPALDPRAKKDDPVSAVVELGDVQGLVARSFNGLEHADYVPVYLPADAAAARAWVGEMADVVTRGDVRSGEVMKAGAARNVGFTPDGLRRLGMDEESMKTFSMEFRDGMTTTYKQRVMGDDGDSAPQNWAWGGTGNPVHAMVFVFANDRARLQSLLDEEGARASRHGVTLGTPLGSIMLNEDKEHFGFHDGIAQPRVQGFRKPDDGESPAPTENSIPAGEVVLGYTNAYGQLPDSPSVPDTPGARAALPKAPRDPDLPRDWPVRRDLGRNGSYVVFRQLEQHVKAFWSFLDLQARHDAERRKKLGAKIVGRWPNGAPLVRHPDTEPEKFDRATANDFLYSGAWDDVRGDKCPLGSHIRRTNPRDGMQPGPAGSLLVSDRHRLLRRGRAYGEPVTTSFDPAEIIASDKPDTGRGLHFICFNTDLGRQFEFVQSTWVNSMKFDGLYRDADPLIGAHHLTGEKDVVPEQVTRFTEQRCPVRHQVHDIPRFVTTVGGAYLFMPGMNALRYLSRLD